MRTQRFHRARMDGEDNREPGLASDGRERIERRRKACLVVHVLRSVEREQKVATGRELESLEDVGPFLGNRDVLRERVDHAERRGCRGTRSEEHTSELQSRLHLVCRLLLEKKKKK